MQVMLGQEPMAKKKSETRRHTAMVRIEAATLERAKKAASLMGLSLSDYVSALVAKATEKDILREAKKLASGGEK